MRGFSRLSSIAALAGAAIAAAHAGADYRVTRLDLPGISSDQWESHPAVDPRTGDLWFVRSDKNFAGWKLMVSRCGAKGWTAATAAPFEAPGLEADPHFTSDGQTLYFISTRASGEMRGAALDIWMAQRGTDGKWAEPVRLPEPVNSDAVEWFPRPAPDGWLYFGSRRAGGYGKDDIWRARHDEEGHWRVENAGPLINTAEGEYEFEPSPDGSWALLAADSGFYRVEQGTNGWERRTRLPDVINATGTEVGPLILPDASTFVFSRDAKDGRSGELFIATNDTGEARLPGPCGGKS